MNAYIILFGRVIPVYGICFWVGIVLSAGLAVMLCGKRKIPRFDIVGSAVYTMIGAMLGAKLLFILVSWPDIISMGLPLEAVIKGGFVFYGGLLGGVAGLWIYIWQFKMDAAALCDIYTVVLPLGHALGRLGCFAAGCCYGIPYDGPFSYTYTFTLGQTPLHTPLLPIQLIEAACLLGLFVMEIIIYLNVPHKQYLPCKVYLFSYPVIRFAVEFFRGDRERGLFCGLSTSQWISVILFLTTLIGCMYATKSNSQTQKASPKSR